MEQMTEELKLAEAALGGDQYLRTKTTWVQDAASCGVGCDCYDLLLYTSGTDDFATEQTPGL